jgi:cytochrome P450
VLGASVTVADLEGDPHALLARLREQEPVAWLPAIDGWLVTRRDLALEAMRDAARFTVHDPRFTTAQVVGESMLSLDGAEHARHRAPFVAPLRLGEVRRRLADAVAAEAERLADELAPRGEAELRRGFAGPLAAAAVTHALGLDGASTGAVLGWYDAIVAAVTDLSAGRPAGPEAARAVEELGAAVDLDAPGLSAAEVRSNVAVLLFGGIETTEGMIANALLHVLAEPVAREQLPAAVEESLRLEPAAAVIDRYATGDTELGAAEIAAGDLVRISITAANRDPAVFPDPDRFDPSRENAGRHLAFAAGPHVCVGMHLARLEAHVALATLLDRLPELELARPAEIRGLIFRKPPSCGAAGELAERLGAQHDAPEQERQHRDRRHHRDRRAAVDAGLVHHRVALAARDQPAVDRHRDDARDRQREREAAPEQQVAEPGVHRAGDEQHDRVVDHLHRRDAQRVDASAIGTTAASASPARSSG